MKKLLVPFEGTAFHQELLEFVGELNQRSRVLLAAVFVPHMDYAQLWTTPGGVISTSFVPPEENEDQVVKKNSGRISRFCNEHCIDYHLHEDRFDFALGAIRKETRFADLLLLSSGHFFEAINGHQPNAYMKEVLDHSECPVLLLPEEPKLPKEVILAYDGSASAAFAIRQYIYLFPELSKVSTTLVYVGDHPDGIPEEPLVRELCEPHFTNFHVMQLHMQAATFCDTWIKEMQSPWLVAGAFGRPEWSQLIKHSFIRRLIREHTVPVFVAHR